MIDYYLRLIESFKEHQISVLLNSIREKIVTTIQGDYFSEHPKAYFNNIECCSLLLTSTAPTIDDISSKLKTAYIMTADNTFYYFDRKADIAFIKLAISDTDLAVLKESIQSNIPSLLPGQITQIITPILTKNQRDLITSITGHLHIECEPFINFSHEPKQITQIKDIINALFHAQLAFTDLEQVNLRSGNNKLADLSKLYTHTIEHAYQASYLLTHLDLDLTEAFSQELSTLLRLLTVIKKYADEHNDSANELAKIIKTYPFSHQSGVVAGIITDQMRPTTGQIDYNFLTQFGAVLPGYIQQLTVYIQQYSLEITNKEPTLNKQKITELEDNAIRLLSSINSLQNSNAIMAFKLINYVSIIRHIITLSTSTIEQMGHLSDQSQDVIRDNLSYLKYNLLTNLFSLTDKIEDEALLAPGTLSKPLMAAVIPYYQELIRYAATPVDFSAKGEELLTIEDSRFIELRLDDTQARINKANVALFKAEQVNQACHDFFNLLETQAPDSRLIDLPEPTKQALIRHYRYIQPYVEKLNVDLNNEIVLGLTKTTGALDKLRNTYNWLKGKSTDKIANSIAIKTSLNQVLKSDVATHKFHIKLNKDLIRHVYKNATLTLRPYHTHIDKLYFDEPSALQLNDEEQNTLKTKITPKAVTFRHQQQLNSDQTLNLYKYYEQKRSQLLRAKETFEEFLAIITAHANTPLCRLDTSVQEKLRNLYLVFQPYFISTLANDKGIDSFDKTIIANLKTNPSKKERPKFPIYVTHFTGHAEKHFINTINIAIKFAEQQRDNYHHIAQEKFIAETQAKVLVPNYSYGNRAHHIIKHTNYSKALSDFRTSFFQLTNLFNLPMRNKLKPASIGVPFPELQDNTSLLAQSKQVLSFKRIFNGLYHLEQIFYQLEQLDNKSSQSIYVSHLIKGYGHIDELYGLIHDLYSDPYLSLMAQELMGKLSAIKQTLLSQSSPYLENASAVTSINGTVQQSALWYPLQALLLVPEHVHAATTQNELSSEKFAAIQCNTKRIVLDIERIIARSNSYFKLLLETPTMYYLFRELKQKLALFTHASHNAILRYLKEINTELFAKIMLETDLWEDKLGLKPGQLSSYMKAILDEFYQGLIEPLGFISHKHIALVTNLDTFDKRLAANNARKTQAAQQQAGIHDNLTAINGLNKTLDHYLSLTQGLIPAPPISIAIIRNELLDTYKKAYPLLLEEQTRQGYQLQLMYKVRPDVSQIDANKIYLYVLADNSLEYAVRDKTGAVVRFNLTTATNNDDGSTTALLSNQLTSIDSTIITALLNQEAGKLAHPQTEAIINATTKAGFSALKPHHTLPINTIPNIDELLNQDNPELPAINNIVALAKLTQGFYQGLDASFQLEQDSAQEKHIYLTALRTEQLEKNQQFIADFITKEFDKRMDIIISRQTDLLHVNLEYNQKLKDFLLSYKNTLVAEALSSTDIKKKIKHLLLAKTQQFQTQHLHEYAQLDNVLSALAEFKVYFQYTHVDISRNKSSVYEDLTTLTKKAQHIDRLELLARNATLPVKNRLDDLRKQVSTGAFQVDILAQRELNTFSFAWLKRCFLSLLTALRLYTPKHVTCYHHLTDAVSENPILSQNRRHYGFFTETERNYNLPQQLGLAQPEVAAAAAPSPPA